MRAHLSLFVIASLVLLSACDIDGKNEAIGDNDVITLICDSSDYDALQEVIENAFTKPFFTPQPEVWFRIVRHDLGDLLDVKKDRNIVIIGALDAGNSMGDYMRSALDADVQALVRKGEQHVFVQRDLWYRGQTVMHIAGATLDDVRNYMASHGPELEYFLKSAWDERERKRLLRMPREEDIEQRLAEKHGFGMCVIKDWFVGKDSSAIGAVLLRRQSPAETERWVLVHYVDNASPEMLTNDVAYATRNRLSEILYRTYDDSSWVVIDSVNYLQFDEVNFQDRFAIRMKGLWRMNDYSMGGPFVSYLFYDEQQRRLYFIDGSAFAPKYEKKKLIQDLDVMLSTFKALPRNEQSPS